MEKPKEHIAIIGLGYVGLPLAIEFGRKYRTLGYDTNAKRIGELQQGIDVTLEAGADEISASKHLELTCSQSDIAKANIYVVTVPTPIDSHKQPDLSCLKEASTMVGAVLNRGDTVIYESTVFPGATEDVCVPILEQESGMKLNQDFSVGYSPERINPGDKERRLTNIVKVTSGSNPQASEHIDKLYASIVEAGTYRAESIKVAEAAKVIENTQRDVNIALVNELAMIFSRMDIDTQAVLEAAGSKWNFLPFRPGLVGGHCIGVDPYYLTHKAESIGYNPVMILSGRRINDRMGEYVASQLLKAMIKRRIQIEGAKILVLGLTFKENCPDIRNTKVIDIVRELESYNAVVDVHDPWVDAKVARDQCDVNLQQLPSEAKYDAVIVAVGHQTFIDVGIDEIRKTAKPNHVLYDLKYIFPAKESDARL